MKESRRAFLKELGGGTLALGVGLPLLDAVPWSSASGAVSPDIALPADPAVSAETQWGLVVDVEKCLQDEVRRAVMDACHREHNVPRIPDPEERIDWVWSEPLEHVFPDEVHDFLAHLEAHMLDPFGNGLGLRVAAFEQVAEPLVEGQNRGVAPFLLGARAGRHHVGKAEQHQLIELLASADHQGTAGQHLLVAQIPQ